jgi:hypothetical protein
VELTQHRLAQESEDQAVRTPVRRLDNVEPGAESPAVMGAGQSHPYPLSGEGTAHHAIHAAKAKRRTHVQVHTVDELIPRGDAFMA